MSPCVCFHVVVSDEQGKDYIAEGRAEGKTFNKAKHAPGVLRLDHQSDDRRQKKAWRFVEVIGSLARQAYTYLNTMAPIRRYLRISKYSVLECRIYLDAPSDSRWLLNPRDPVLPRVIAAIQPLVLPKLREENQRLFSRKKSKPVKDVIAEDDFEVAIFLRESRTRHSLLTRNKTFHGHGTQDRNPDSVSGPGDDTENPTGSTNDEIMIESDSEPEGLHDIPESTGDEAPASARPKRKSKLKAGGVQLEDDTGTDEKKLRFSTHYESFNICGWVLCLLVTRKGGKAKSSAATAETPRQPLMEEWISTQAQASVDD